MEARRENQVVSISYVKSHTNPIRNKTTQQVLSYTSNCKMIQSLSAASTAKWATAQCNLGSNLRRKEPEKKNRSIHRLKQKWSFVAGVILLRHDLCLYCLLGSHHGMAFLWKIPMSMHWAWIVRAAFRPLVLCQTLKVFKCPLKTRECIVNVPRVKSRTGSQAQAAVLGTSGAISPTLPGGNAGHRHLDWDKYCSSPILLDGFKLSLSL